MRAAGLMALAPPTPVAWWPGARSLPDSVVRRLPRAKDRVALPVDGGRSATGQVVTPPRPEPIGHDRTLGRAADPVRWRDRLHAPGPSVVAAPGATRWAARSRWSSPPSRRPPPWHRACRRPSPTPPSRSCDAAPARCRRLRRSVSTAPSGGSDGPQRWRWDCWCRSWPWRPPRGPAAAEPVPRLAGSRLTRRTYHRRVLSPSAIVFSGRSSSCAGPSIQTSAPAPRERPLPSPPLRPHLFVERRPSHHTRVTRSAGARGSQRKSTGCSLVHIPRRWHSVSEPPPSDDSGAPLRAVTSSAPPTAARRSWTSTRPARWPHATSAAIAAGWVARPRLPRRARRTDVAPRRWHHGPVMPATAP